MNYVNRQHAGRVLAGLLQNYRQQPDTLVLALPRGGVPVACEIATQLSLPVDVFVVRKLGIPEHPEYAMGAIASGGTVVFNEEIILGLAIKATAIDTILQAEKNELMRRERAYRANRPYPHLAGKTIILVDDGMATGYTMRAAIAALHQQQPTAIVIAVPVAARTTCEEISPLVNVLVCPLQPVDFHAVGCWYDDFNQTSDEEVMHLLAAAHPATS